MVDDSNPENLLECTLYGKFQVTTANSVTGLGDKPQIFDCGIYNVLGEARDGYWHWCWPPVGSFDFSTADGGYATWKCTSAEVLRGTTPRTESSTRPTGVPPFFPRTSTGRIPRGTRSTRSTCYTLYDGVVLNPTDKAECE